MKICLINPPQILNKRFGIPSVFQPVGLLYVAASLEKKYDVKVIDATVEGWERLKEIDGKYYLGLTIDEIEKRIKRIRPDIVGISIPFSINENAALNIAASVKAIDRNIITIVGGAHPSACPTQMAAFNYIDFVVIGEGEQTMNELLEKIKLSRPLRVWFKIDLWL